MDQLRLGFRLLAAVVATLFSRLTRGPARPTWSFMFEAIVGSLRRTAILFGALDPHDQRSAWKGIAQPNAMRRKVRIEPVVAGDVPARWIVPINVAENAPVLAYFHGGSYRYGSYESHAELVSRLAIAAGVRVLFVEYRLAPPYRFPCAVDDVTNATRWLCHTVGANRVVVGGDSAGGGLALATLLTLRDAREPLPAAALLICPWVDVTARGGSLEAHAQFDWALPEHFVDWAHGYADEAQWKDPRVSPTYADLKGLPPLLIQVGGAEMILDQVQAFAAKAKAAGVDARLTVEPDMIHNWHVLAGFSPVARKSIDEAAAFIRDSVRAA